jgi:hypothetical protein
MGKYISKMFVNLLCISQPTHCVSIKKPLSVNNGIGNNRCLSTDSYINKHIFLNRAVTIEDGEKSSYQYAVIG